MKAISFETKYLKDAHLFYRRHCHHDHTLLLESAEIVEKTGVNSLIGVRCAVVVKCDDLKVTATALSKNGAHLLEKAAKKLGAKLEGDSFTIAYSRPGKGLDEDSRLKAPGPLDVMREIRKCTAKCEGIFIGGNISFDFINNFEIGRAHV